MTYDEYDSLIISLLNLSTDNISSFKHIVKDDKLSIYLTIKRSFEYCPTCGSVHFKSIGYYTRKLVIPNELFSNISVFLKVPRIICMDCNSTASDSKHISPHNASVSFKTIQKVMALLKNPEMTFSLVAKLLDIPLSSVISIFDKYCHIEKIPFPEAICIDEIYTKNNDYDNSHYSCLFFDFYNHSLVDVTPCRRKNYLHHYLQKRSKNELNNVKIVSIDMYYPYKDIAQIYFKKAIICVDSFHVIEHLNNDLSKIRVRIMNKYNKNSTEYYLLKRWKNLLFTPSDSLDNEAKMNHKLNQYANYRTLLNLMLQVDSQLKDAYFLKEEYMSFNRSSTVESASKNIDSIIQDFKNSNIPEYEEFTTLLTNWRQEIINSFTIYKGKRINSSIAENMNSIAAKIIYNSKGIRNSERRRKRILYAVNKTNFIIK